MPNASRRTVSVAVALWAVPVLIAAAGCRQPTRTAVEPVAAAQVAAQERIAAERSINVAALPERSVGVAPLGVNASDTTLAPLAYGLADLLMTDLARSKQLVVVERLRMDALLRELSLAKGGRVDTATAPRVGKLLGARRLVVGALTQTPGSRVRVDARIADVSTQQVRAAVSATTTVNEILDAEKALAFRLFEQLNVNLTPAERRAVEERPTKNLAALLAYSRGVRYEAEGQYAAAAREYGTALRLDPGFTASQRRLNDVKAAAPSTAGRVVGAGQLDRAVATTTDNVNRPNVNTSNQDRQGVADPSASLGQFVDVIITVEVTP
jgi:TolB-like protein